MQYRPRVQAFWACASGRCRSHGQQPQRVLYEIGIATKVGARPLMGGELPVIPPLGAPSVAQLVSAPARRWRQLPQPMLQKTRLTCYSGAGFEPELASWGGR
jgi:hypothetical protein